MWYSQQSRSSGKPWSKCPTTRRTVVPWINSTSKGEEPLGYLLCSVVVVHRFLVMAQPRAEGTEPEFQTGKGPHHVSTDHPILIPQSFYG